MNANYTTEKGRKLRVFLWSDLLEEGNTVRNTIEIVETDNNNKTVVKNLHKDEKGLFFVWDKVPVYLNDFDYMSAKELVESINTAKANNDWVFEDDILATLLKESDKLHIVYPLPKVEMVIPIIGIAITGSKVQEVVCKFTEERYKKSQWGYKVSLEAVSNADKMNYVSRHPYFSDLCTEIRRGQAELRLANNEIVA